ncbi:MAG: PAS domain S-box protein [Thermodesulfobacteriota bacterium]|nr:PAS domain S-box protein [Thermodesulfobacteriota bacterium]
MKDESKTREQLINELLELRQRITDLEKAENRYKEMEQALQKTEEEKTIILEAMSELVIYVDTKMKILWANRAAAESVGMTTDALVGSYCYKEWFQNSEPCPDCPATKILKTGQPQQGETISPDGRVWFFRGYPVRNAAGEIIAIVEVVQEITERKRMEDTLRQSEEKYRRLIETANDAIFIADVETGTILEVNKRAEELLGLPAEKIVGMHQAKLHPKEEAERYQKIFLEHTRSGRALAENLFVLDRDGRKIPVEISASVVEIGGRKIIQGIFHNITERRRAEEEIISAKARLQYLLTCNPAIIYSCEAGGSYPATFVSDNAKTLFGYEAREFTENPDFWADHIHPEDRPRIFADLSRLFEKRHHLHEYRFLHKDGTYRWVRDELKLVRDEKGSPLEIIGYMADITRERQLEEELFRRQKIESLGVLAGGIAHDFNNILTGIMGHINIAQMHMGSPGTALHLLNEAERACLRARDLTQQLLTFSKGGAPVKKIISISGLLKDSARFALHGCNIQCQFSIPDDIWPVEVDEGQVAQVINNLVINASQAMPGGGIIKIQAQNMVVGAENPGPLKDGRHVKITVTDQGIGIPQKHLQKIFEPYFTTKQKGSGLGLAVAYSIIKKHSGHIEAEAPVGAGTTFSIYLPASGDIPAATGEKKAKTSKRTGRILVMDDDDSVRSVAGWMLKTLGHDVEFARDGAEAIELYKAAGETCAPFTAVIMDLTVPGGMGGKETVKKLQEIDPNIKVIVSSGYSDDPVMANFTEYGFCSAIAKPYNLAELSRTLREAIG